MLGFTVAGINIQPSELVKIVFVFFVASSFKRSTEFKDLVVTTVVAAFHVLILVVSKDLGAALIIFVVYLVMLYVATHQPLYILAGLGAGSLGAVAAYHLFTHVKTRVNVWRDPFGTYDNGGYQVAQSLFAIGTGGWFGAGLYQGQPDTIPVSAEDFIFSAISEEMGLIYAMCLILICVSCYVMFLNIAMQMKEQFYKLVALHIPGVLDNRRGNEVHSVNRCNTSACKLWWKFADQYTDHVCNYPGTVYFKRRRGRGY